MKEWEEVKEDTREITKDKEIANSLLKMIDVRIDALKHLDTELHTSIIVDGYYEVIKEAITALMAIDGYKTTSHEALVVYLKQFYKKFEEYEITFIDEMRKIRNKIDYKGFFVSKNYLERNLLEIQSIITKLKETIKEKLKG